MRAQWRADHLFLCTAGVVMKTSDPAIGEQSMDSTSDRQDNHGERMSRKFVLQHLITMAAGTLALWWFIYPDWPEEAVADRLIAAGFATFVETLAVRFGW
jgi:hypothetical protein